MRLDALGINLHTASGCHTVSFPLLSIFPQNHHKSSSISQSTYCTDLYRTISNITQLCLTPFFFLASVNSPSNLKPCFDGTVERELVGLYQNQKKINNTCQDISAKYYKRISEHLVILGAQCLPSPTQCWWCALGASLP